MRELFCLACTDQELGLAVKTVVCFCTAGFAVFFLTAHDAGIMHCELLIVNSVCLQSTACKNSGLSMLVTGSIIVLAMINIDAQALLV